jgi:hypothetical protein
MNDRYLWEYYNIFDRFSQVTFIFINKNAILDNIYNLKLF